MEEEQLSHDQAKEIIRFQISYNRRRIKSTWALAILIVGIFLLEELFGGSQNMAVLVRMGANVSTRVAAGEYYRLLTSVFLHAGFMHVFFNTYVLFALGGFFNRILGESRYLTVFFVSGLTGSLASFCFGKSSVSVGASGAIWGLFGASLAIAFFKTSLVPETIRLRLRRVTLINLLINLGISFLPMIDFWAHVGGGVGGFLVSLLMVMGPFRKQWYRFATYGFRCVATVLGLLYAASMVYVFVEFKPYKDQLSGELKPVNFSQVPFTMMAPNLALTVEEGTSSSMHYVFGDPQLDRLVLEVHFVSPGLGKVVDENWLTIQRDEMLRGTTLASDAKKTVYLRDTPNGRVLYYRYQPKNSDVAVHTYLVTRQEYVVKLSFLVGEDVQQVAVDKIAQSVIDSVRHK